MEVCRWCTLDQWSRHLPEEYPGEVHEETNPDTSETVSEDLEGESDSEESFIMTPEERETAEGLSMVWTTWYERRN